MQSYKTREEYNKKMQELSNRLGKWPRIKTQALKLIKEHGEGYSSENCKEDHKQTLRQYERLKPFREQVKELKAERDKFFPSQAKKPEIKRPSYLKVLRASGHSIVFEHEGRQLEINKSFIEEFKRILYQIPVEQAGRLERFCVDRTGQDLRKPFFNRSDYGSEIRSGIWAKKR